MNSKNSPPFNNLKRSPFRQVSLRTKLTLGNMLITFIAIIGMGYYVYFRTQRTNALLTAQFETNIHIEVEDELSSESREQAALLNEFFSSMSKNASTLGAMQENMLAQESLLNGGAYWNAPTALARLSSGSWDNANTETASVFIPASVDLTPELVSKLNVIKQVELTFPSILTNNPDIIAIYFGGTDKETIYYPNIDLANIVPPDFDITSRPWFVAAAPAQNQNKDVIWSAPYQDAALNGLVITTSFPVYGPANHFAGVTAMDIQLNKITSLVSNIHIGETGYAFLIDKDNRLIALPEAGYKDFGVTAETAPLGEVLDETKLTNVSSDFFEMLSATSKDDNVILAKLGGVERFVAYHRIPEVEYTLMLIVPSEEMLSQAAKLNTQITQETTNTIRVSIILISIILAIATLATFGVGNRLTAPLKTLINVANQIIAGNTSAKAEIDSRDEIGVLAETLNVMTSTLRDSIYTLEQRVDERTREIERRSNLLKAVADVGKAITSFRDLSELLQQTTYLIHENFGYYHAGIFLLDEHKEYAVLSAANSEGGRRMLEKKHQLKIGETGIVGWVTQNAKARIALDVGKDATYFNNPDLPETRSELALPLVVGGQVLGALDVQSKESQAFSEEDSSTLQILAEQIAVTIQNANLFSETEKALESSRLIYSEVSREAWSKILRNQPRVGFIATPPITTQTRSESVEPSIGKAFETGDIILGSDNITISLPIKVRGQTIGAIRLKKSEISEAWTQEETDLAVALSDQISGALESARLYRESQQRGARESLVSDISARISAVSNTEAIVRETVQELGQTLGNASVTFQLFDQKNKNSDTRLPRNPMDNIEKAGE